MWTDITQYVLLRNVIAISNMGRTDETGSISPAQLNLTLRNDGRFTPKNVSSPYYPNIVRNCQIRLSVNATSASSVTHPPLNLNTGFEVDASNWTAANSATIARSTAQARTGSGSLTLHGNGTVASPQAISEKEPVVAGQQYSATAWWFNTSVYASGVSTILTWYNAAGGTISTVTGSSGSLAANTWTQVTATGTAPALAAQASITVSISGTPASGNNFFADDAVLAATSGAGIGYSGYRFWGEVASWPPSYDVSQRDTYAQITASGIWRRISQANVPIGSCFWRYVELLTGTSVPAAYWSMEDGSSGTGLNGFTLSEGTGTNMTVTSAPSYAADGTSFPGSSALPQPNGARFAGNVTMASTPSAFAVWFAVSVPAAGDSGTSQYTTGGQLIKILTGGTVATIIVNITQGNQLNVSGQNAGGTVLFTGTVPTKVNGVPVLCSYEQTAGAYALKIIKPGAGSLLDQVTASGFSWTTGKVTQVQVNSQGKAQDTTIGQIVVLGISTASIVTAAGYIGGQAGETATARLTRICGESNIPITITGSGGAALGPQVSDTMANILQSIEDTDGGLLFETTAQFGLGYRTLASMQNQAPTLNIAHNSGALGEPLVPTYDDQLIKNSWTVTNYDGYATTAQLNSGAMSVLAPPNGVGPGYSASKTINANTHAQVTAIAQQLLFQGTVDDVRYPTVVVSFMRTAAAPYFSALPSMDLGDYFTISNLPGFLGSGTAKQLCWGYSERMGGQFDDWTITFNAIPELPFETSFSPGSFTNLQGSAGGVPQGSSVGSTVSGSQLGPGSVGPNQAGIVLTARSIGGATSFISAATPYKWSFAVTGTPANATYFICAPDQATAIAAGDTFVNSSGFGGPFTVTQVDQASAGTTTVHFTPDASSVMSSGTVQGGTNGDQWINTSAGNQISQWSAGVWNPITWDGNSVINTGTVYADQLFTPSVVAGVIAAGAIDGMTITGVQINGASISGDTVTLSGANDGLFAYGSAANVVATYSVAGTYTWLCPTGVTSVYAECWGAGASGATGVGTSNQGGSGGEYAAEPSFSTTPGNTYYITVGAAGAGRTVIGPIAGNNGGNSWFNSSNVQGGVVAHGGQGGATSGGRTPGGTGSSNTIHFDGGNSGIGYNGGSGGGGGGGGGGGASGGPGGTGTSGHDTPSAARGTGGAAGANSGSGGTGGDGYSPGSGAHNNSYHGIAPGGGGGAAGWFGSFDGDSLDAAAGMVRLSYNSSTTALVASVAGFAGVDPVNAQPVPAGFMGPAVAVQPGSSPVAAETWHTITLDSGWSTLAGHPNPAYRLLPSGDVELVGYISRSSFTGTTAVNNSNPLPSAYRPTNQVYLRGGDGNRSGVAVTTAGVINAFPVSGGSTQTELSGCIYPLGV